MADRHDVNKDLMLHWKKMEQIFGIYFKANLLSNFTEASQISIALRHTQGVLCTKITHTRKNKGK